MLFMGISRQALRMAVYALPDDPEFGRFAA
jgi:hypothetical protein